MVIYVNVKDKRASVIGAPVIVCGNSGYTVEFTFDDEWAGLRVKTARFVYVQAGEVKYQDVVFEGATAVVPVLANVFEVRVGVFAGDLQTSTPAVIPCERSIRCGTGSPADPTPSQYDQIMALLRISDPENLVRLNQGTENAGKVLVVGEDGNVHPQTDTETITLLNDCGIVAPVVDGGGAIYTADENTIYIL